MGDHKLVENESVHVGEVWQSSGYCLCGRWAIWKPAATQDAAENAVRYDYEEHAHADA